jgi:Fe-S-cluster-containing hydrogenase component 2
MKRNIIKIDEDKCTGCGECIPDCPEGALAIVDGKVRLVKESLCDGLGACVGRCPTGALTVEERDADAFDEHEAEKNMKAHAAQASQPVEPRQYQGGCPGKMMKLWSGESKPVQAAGGSALRQWPVELKLLNPLAPYFQNAHLLIAADCVAFAFGNFHQRFLEGKALVVFCPKLDNAHEEYIEKLSLILKQNNIQSLTVVHMEVPCCSATTHIVEQALKLSGKSLVIKDYTISLQGEII